MDILLAPVYSFFSTSFYRRVIRYSVGKGFLYLAFLSLIYSLLILFFFWTPFKPNIDKFVNWFAANLPQLTLTKEGVLTSVTQPFQLKSPVYGSVLVIDTTKDTLEGMPSETLIYMTKTKLVFKNQNRNELRVFELVPSTEEAKAKWKDFVLTGPFLEGWYKKLVPVVIPAILIVVFWMFFVWKILASLFYSLIALLINLFRREKLGYGHLLTLSMFALTPVAVLQIFSLFIPRMGIALNFFTAVILTSLYLALGILATQEKSPESSV